MAHTLILGMTLSGKTTLAKKLAATYRAKGISVLVLDPIGDPTWPADFRTSDVDEFLDVFWASRGCAVFFDESGDYAGQHDKKMQTTATKGRHWGHRCHYISQRGTMINRTIRDQCVNLFLFGTALEDTKVHAKEWNKPQILEAAKFKQGDYYHVTRFGEISQSNIFGVTNHDSSNKISDVSGGSSIGGNSADEQNAGDGNKATSKGKARTAATTNPNARGNTK